MGEKLDINAVYVPSEDIVAREIESELIIVPLVSGIADMEDDLFALSPTARAIWEKLDGKRNLRDVIEDLSAKYEGTKEEIEEDVIGLMNELIKRKIVVAA